MPYSFVFFSYKSIVVHQRTIFSVLSLIANYDYDINDKILLYTDDSYYLKQFLKNILIVEYVDIDEKSIISMMGEYDLIHRVKIGIIEKTFNQYPQNIILYADSDTFFTANMSNSLQEISVKNSIMHKYEFSFKDINQQQEIDITKEYCNLFNENKFKIDNELVSIVPNFSSWNAGIIGLHHENKNWLNAVYQLTDQTYAKVRHHACEQFSFSYVLQTKGTLTDFEKYNRHYWHSTEKKIADKLLSEKLNNDFAKLSLKDKKEQVKKYCNHLLKLFPNHEYTHSYNAMIAFQSKMYLVGFKHIFLTLLKNPFQNVKFFKDVLHYIKIWLIDRITFLKTF